MTLTLTLTLTLTPPLTLVSVPDPTPSEHDAAVYEHHITDLQHTVESLHEAAAERASEATLLTDQLTEALALHALAEKQWVEAERLLTASHEEVQGLQKRVDLLEASELARRVQVVCSTSGCLSLPRPF